MVMRVFGYSYFLRLRITAWYALKVNMQLISHLITGALRYGMRCQGITVLPAVVPPRLYEQIV